MIKDLIDYYEILERKYKDPATTPFHFLKGNEMIFNPSYAIKIDIDGNLIGIDDIRQEVPDYSKSKETKKEQERPTKLVPLKVKYSYSGKTDRSSDTCPIILCDNGKYMAFLKIEKKSIIQNKKVIDATIKLNLDFWSQIQHPVALAIFKYYQKLKEDNQIVERALNLVDENGNISKDAEEKVNANYILRVVNDKNELILPETIKEIQDALNNISTNNVQKGICFITGKKDTDVAILHKSISGVPGTSMANTPFISFNDCPCTNFMGQPAKNSITISLDSMQKYTNVLKFLLHDKSHHINLSFDTKINDSVAIFWSTRKGNKTELDDIADNCTSDVLRAFLKGIYLEDEPEEISEIENSEFQKESLESAQKMRKLIMQFKTGRELISEIKIPDDVEVHILILKSNAGRIAVGDYYVSNYESFFDGIYSYYEDMKIETNNKFKFPGFDDILSIAAPNNKSAHYSFRQKLFNSILHNKQLPQALFNKILERYKVEYSTKKYKVSELIWKEQFIRAYLLRNKRLKEGNLKNMENNESLYFKLGRIFALYERAEEHVKGNLGNCVTSSLFSSYVSRPISTLPLIQKKANVYILKLLKKNETTGLAINLTKQIDSLLEEIDIASISKLVSREAQSEILIGHSTQRNQFFKKKDILVEFED